MKTAEKRESVKTITGDEEELAYTDFAEGSEQSRSDMAVYSGEEEDYAYTGYATEVGNRAEYIDVNDVDAGVTATDLGTFGDGIIESFSIESNAKNMSKFIKLPEEVAKYFMGVIYIALGLVCAIIPHRIEYALPYVVGGLLGFISIVRFIHALMDKEYIVTHSNKTASSLIMLGVSIMIIIEHEWAHTFIPIVWGVWGLFEGAHAFNHAISRIVRHKRFLYYIIKGVTEVVVAFLLLYEPEQYGELHIIVFGISLILDGIVVLPFVHKFVTRS